MKTVESWLPVAIDIARERLLKKDPNDQIQKINKEFNGYISSFGAPIISGGLLSAVIFFSQEGESSQRHLIIPCIERILKSKNCLESHQKLLDEILSISKLNRVQDLNRLTDKVSTAAVALKLAIRTFPKTT